MPQLDFPSYGSMLGSIFVLFWGGYFLYRFGTLGLVWKKLRLTTRDNSQLLFALPLLINSPLDQFLVLLVAGCRQFGISTFTVGYGLVLLAMNLLGVLAAKKWVEVVVRTSVMPGLRSISSGPMTPVKGYDQIYSYVFVTILIANLAGMIPYMITITSFTAFTFFLSFTMFLAINIIAIHVHHGAFVGTFLPGGSPIVMAPFLVVLELVSYSVRPFSLGIRLFANLLAGHSLVKILAGFAGSMLSFSALGVLMVLPGAAVFAVTVLEVGIAALQAYVFITLCAIYMSEIVKLH